jgi:hypothetical protein
MAPIPHAREGATLFIKERLLPFSFFPTTRDKRRWGLYDALFAMSPWSVMEAAVRDRVDDEALQDEALAFLEQAQDFYSAADARISTNPLLLYYAFLNLGKALLLTIGYPESLERASHGLSERRTGEGVELDDSVVVVQSLNNRVNVYAELVERLGFPRPRNGDTYPVVGLLPQVVVGHRIWREADASNRERFVGLTEVEIVKADKAKQLRLRLYLERGDLKRYGITRKRLFDDGGLGTSFREVKVEETGHAAELVCLEQSTVMSYSGRPSDVVMDLVTPTRPLLWRIVTTAPAGAYRKYYLHLSDAGEPRLPQIASLWALFFYFGSIVRYRPHLFDSVTAGRYGAFANEFISAQAGQMLYLLASEMCAREIARPAII